MEQLDIFGSKLHEYLLVIEPDSKTKERIIEFRELVNKIIPLSRESLESKPHISLCYFEATNFSDELIISRAQQAISAITPFDVVLDGCEKWKNGTFVVKVNQDKHINHLLEKLTVVFKGVIKTPHLTIARNIAGKLLDQLPMENFEYKSEFKCESIYILKKKESNPYQLLDTIYLKEDRSKF